MKIVVNVIAVLVVLTGLIWLLQGIGILLGSFMSNQAQWALIGIVMVVIGIGVLVYNNRRKPTL